MSMYSDFQGTYKEEIRIGLKTNFIGFRTNGGITEFRNFGGSWTPIPIGGYFSLNTTPTPNVVRQPTTAAYTEDFVFGSTQLDTTGTVLHYGRFLFDKSKAAFRAGYVSGTQWDDANRGLYSFAIGSDCRASGQNAFAGGDSSIAHGTGSVAIGTSITVNGGYTVVFGGGGTHAGGYCGGFGLSHTLTGNYGFASGSSQVITGTNGFAAGNGNTVSGDYSVALGRGHTIGSNYAIGFGTNARSYWYGQQVYASGSMATDGDVQAGKLHYYGTGTAGYLSPGNSTTNAINMPSNKAYAFQVTVMGTCVVAGGGVTVGQTCKFELDVIATNIAGTATIASHITNIIARPTSMAAATTSMTVTGVELRLNVVNPAGCTMRWTALAHIDEIGW